MKHNEFKKITKALENSSYLARNMEPNARVVALEIIEEKLRRFVK